MGIFKKIFGPSPSKYLLYSDEELSELESKLFKNVVFFAGFACTVKGHEDELQRVKEEIVRRGMQSRAKDVPKVVKT